VNGVLRQDWWMATGRSSRAWRRRGSCRACTTVTTSSAWRF